MEELVTVATFNDWDKAITLRARLDEAGIPSQVFDETQAQWFLWFTPARAAMRVRVEKERAEEAKALLHTWQETDHVLDGAIRCPECGSSSIEYPQFSRKTLMTMVFAVLPYLGMFRKQYFCESCHFTWEADPDPKQPVLDELNWSIKHPPNYHPPT